MLYCLRYLVALSRGVMGCPLFPPEAARFLLFLSPGYGRMWAKGGDKMKSNFDKNKLSQVIREKAEDAAQKKVYAVECPHCHSKVQITPGEHLCPSCGKAINLTLNFN